MPRPAPLPLALSLLALALAACQTVPVEAPDTMRRLDGELVYAPIGSAAPVTPAGACWDHQVTPAVIETVTEQVQVAPERGDDVTGVVTPARYRSVQRTRIKRERGEIWFRSPCPAELSPDVVAGLQRALAARGLYQGTPTGVIDPPTAAAIRAFQTPRGLKSGQLSLTAAEELGMIPVPRG
ncbi:peptidoglycan-binding domain-containing protein [Frigidibacter sp. MR17.14]|uniref:peptidoglycan-binding domain-containing protein n=1 Tax=Frigidibacter sp. MR17.14 TaxID=3126509 RepID=UPI003012FFE8